MPLYQYHCLNPECDKIYDIHHPMSETGLVRYCPHCYIVLERVFFPVGIVFKGGGFYASDHRREQIEKNHDKFDKPEGYDEGENSS